jgi:hypothetical protein
MADVRTFETTGITAPLQHPLVKFEHDSWKDIVTCINFFYFFIFRLWIQTRREPCENIAFRWLAVTNERLDLDI